jgi:hypothetical protein
VGDSRCAATYHRRSTLHPMRDDDPKRPVPGAETTGRLERESNASDTAQFRDASPADLETSAEPAVPSVEESPQPGASPPWRDFTSAMGSAFVRAGWPTFTAAACIAFLAVLCVAVVLVTAIKLQYPGFGAGADPISILTTFVILGLASLGADVRIDRLELSAIPLGALLACGVAIAWAAAAAVRRRDAPTRATRAFEGAKIAIPFAVICLVASLSFTISGQNKVSVDPASAAIMAALWGVLFGALGGLRAAESRGDLLRATGAALGSKGPPWYGGVFGGISALVAAATLSIGAGLLWVVVALASGAPEGRFEATDAVAAVIYLSAFGPNVMVSIIAVSLGAPLEIGARVSVGGKLMGPLREISLFDWPGGTPWFAFLLLAIPVLAGLIAGFSARRADDKGGVVATLVTAAAVFAGSVFLFTLAAEARLGAGLVEARGFGRVAPNPWLSAGFAFLWCLAAGYGGWRLAQASRSSADARE